MGFDSDYNCPRSLGEMCQREFVGGFIMKHIAIAFCLVTAAFGGHAETNWEQLCDMMVKCSTKNDPVVCKLGDFSAAEINSCIAEKLLREKICAAKAFDLDYEKVICEEITLEKYGDPNDTTFYDIGSLVNLNPFHNFIGKYEVMSEICDGRRMIPSGDKHRFEINEVDRPLHLKIMRHDSHGNGVTSTLPLESGFSGAYLDPTYLGNVKIRPNTESTAVRVYTQQGIRPMESTIEILSISKIKDNSFRIVVDYSSTQSVDVVSHRYRDIKSTCTIDLEKHME